MKNLASSSGMSGKMLNSDSIRIELAKHSMSSELLQKIISGDESLIASALSILQNRAADGGSSNLKEVFNTKLGKLFNGDCRSLLNQIADDSLDCVFADPPFNLSKNYCNGKSDDMHDHDYLEWSYGWLEACAKKLKQGGSLFVYNIPKWAIYYAAFLNNQLNFKNWIAIDVTLSMPIKGRLYPSHYSLLYFVKGYKASVFTPPRVPIKTCVRCGQEQNDYGGHKMKMNPNGLNIRDVWTDIPPVRHSKYKNRDANELSLKLLDRVLDIATKPGDLVFDPFGGSGTTFIAAELKGRRWIGSELGSCADIIKRFNFIENDLEHLNSIRKDVNTLFTDKAIQLRAESGLPLNNYKISDNQIIRSLGSASIMNCDKCEIRYEKDHKCNA